MVAARHHRVEPGLRALADSPNAARNKPLTIDALTFGASDRNYAVTWQSAPVIDVLPVVLNLSGSKVYDRGRAVAAAALSDSGSVQGIHDETIGLTGAGIAEAAAAAT